MPYAKWSEVNAAIKGIKPRVTMAMANHIADMADAMSGDKNIESPWGVAVSNFKKEYKISGGKWVKRKKSSKQEAELMPKTFQIDADLAELAFGYQETMSILRGAFYAEFDTRPGGERMYHYWCKDFYYEHPEFGSALLIEVEKDNTLFLVPFEMTESGEVTFGETDSWRKAIYRLALADEEMEEDEDAGEDEGGEELSEAELLTTGHTIRLVEQGDVATGGLEPLIMEIALIEPGYGNKRDNHYYPAEVLKRDAHVFNGVQMHETDHREAERSNKTWVSTVMDCPTGFTESGAPIAKVGVHDPNFAARVINLDKLGVLEKLQNSILAIGTSKKGKVDGEKANVIESITEGIFVDWVTRAGAGGRALKLTEKEPTMSKNGKDKEVQVEESAEEQEVVLSEEEGEGAEPTEAEHLKEAEVSAIVEASSLPKAAKARLLKGEYTDTKAVEAAVKAEVDYLKEVTGSGKVQDLGAGEAPDDKALSEDEYGAAVNEIWSRHGLEPVVTVKEAS